MSEQDYRGGRSDAFDEIVSLVEAHFEKSDGRRPSRQDILKAVEQAMSEDESDLDCISDMEWADEAEDWDDDREAWKEHHLDIYWGMELAEERLFYDVERVIKALTGTEKITTSE